MVSLVGLPGIGKSRMVLETTSLSAERDVEVFTTYCESHTSDIPFQVATRLLRDVLSVSGIDDATARAGARAVHWIDQTSEAMFNEFAAVVPRTHLPVLVTHRPEYQGALDRLPSSHRIPLAPLHGSDATALGAELLGPDSSVAALVTQVAERAAGNPLFTEELVRDLAERGVVSGR